MHIATVTIPIIMILFSAALGILLWGERKLRKSAKIFPVMIVNIETNIYLCYGTGGVTLWLLFMYGL